MSRRPLTTLLATSTAVAACVVAGSLATDPKGQWYGSLRKPSFTPPSWVIPVAWTTLYVDIALTSAVALNVLTEEGEDQEAARYRRALTVNLALNAGWSYVFFQRQHLPAATLWAAALAASSIDLVSRTSKVSPGAGAALVPYAAWTSFATVLTAGIWSKNR